MDEATTQACQQRPSRVPLATYRAQFNREFTFAHATAIVEYLADLGISDLYASPLLQAGPDSTHGYDICSFQALNPSLGSIQEFEYLASTLRTRSMGLLVDMVPNHMGAALSNCWWFDVLEKGPSSRYATWFDIDWQPQHSEFQGKVLIPVLEDHYVKVLEAGKLKLVFEEGQFGIAYYERRFPLAPHCYQTVLELMLEQDGPAPAEQEMLRTMAAFTQSLGRAEAVGPSQAAEFEKVKQQLRKWHKNSDEFRERLNRVLKWINGKPQEPGSFDALDQLLRKQHYRLAFWRVGSQEINYRRFFDVTELVSLRMELPQVFNDSHELLLRFVREGKITGLRIDHPDGLWDPKEYCERLQESCGAPFYVVVEKILTGNEPLPQNWPVAGTTGYDFLKHLNAIFVCQENEAAFDDLYRDFGASAVGCSNHPQQLLAAAPTRPFETVMSAGKELILRCSLISELNSLAHRLKAMAAQTRLGQDLPFTELHAALLSVIVAFPVYRTYATPHSQTLSELETRYILEAMDKARKSNPAVDPLAFDFIQKLLLLEPFAAAGETAQAARDWVMKFQQLTGPTMAKGLEDTAFYNYNRLVSLNEVGGDPGEFGDSVDSFHAYNQMKASSWPHSLLATATHDTKRGEDVRARLNVLSEMPQQWLAAIGRWARQNASHKTAVEGQPAPSTNDEYLFYQTLVGAWIPEAEMGEGLQRFRQRLSAYMLKAIREAKAHTSWTSPDEAYEKATERFVERALTEDTAREFLNDFKIFHRTVDFFGTFNSLSQLVIKLTSPGVPDIYQGTELWDFNLVDPDNRRPVNYEQRRRVLQEIKTAAQSEPGLRNLLPKILNQRPNGNMKLFVLWRSLELRRNEPQLFQQGAYVPLRIEGEKGKHLYAFARQYQRKTLLVVAPRFLWTLLSGVEEMPLGSKVWGDTRVQLPSELRGNHWSNAITGESFETPDKGLLRVGAALVSFPAALLLKES